MSKANSDKQGDTDVLRARDIVPPYSKRNQPSENITPPVAEKKVERASDVPAKASDAEQKGKIPKFDLAEEIMAEQRKITATRRKAPSKTGPVRDPKDLGPKDKGSNGAGMIEAGLRRAQSSRVAGPGKKTEAPSQEQEVGRDSVLQKHRKMGGQPIGYAIKQPSPVLAEQEQIVAEIVARDIEKLCGRLDA